MVRIVLRILLLLPGIAACLPLAAYAAGRTFTDRFHIAQFMYWAPGLWLLGGGTALTVVFLVAHALSRASRRGVPERWASRVLVVALLAGWGHYGLAEAHVHRALARSRTIVGAERPQTTGETLRVVQWNATSPDVVPRPTLLLPLLARFDPDVLLATAAMAPHQYAAVIQDLPRNLHATRSGGLVVVSKRPILDATTHPLGLADPVSAAFVQPRPGALPPAPDELRANWETLYNSYGPELGLQRRQFRNADPGFLTIIRLAPRAEGQAPLVLWHVDLPSDPLRSKWQLARTVAGRIAELTRGTPLLIIGDFNIPRGSASLRRAFGAVESAFDQIGWGIEPTWPRRSPVLQIDQALLPRPLQASGWGTFDPGVSDHRAIIVDLNLSGPGVP
ncbi:MAG: endonuclease/exonuclease/phosphatase family protein [Phycisphaerales bacterium]